MLGRWDGHGLTCVDIGVGYSKEEFIIPTSLFHQVNVVPLARTKQTARKWTQAEIDAELARRAAAKKKKEEEMKKKKD